MTESCFALLIFKSRSFFYLNFFLPNCACQRKIISKTTTSPIVLSQENTTENYAQRDNFKMTMIAVWFFILLNVSNGFTTYQNESLALGLVQELHLRPNMTVRLTVNSTLNPLDINDKFWSFEAHSFSSNDHLSLSKTELPKGYVLYICEECFGKNCFFLTYILKYFCMN